MREVALGASDIEVRIWRGFGLTNLEGVVLGRIDGEWSATHLQTNSYSKKTKVVRTEMLVPKGGWDKFWNELEGLGLLSIKGTNLGQECRVLDGIAHVVETSIDGVYRTYTYPSGVQRCDGSLQMDVISETIGIEFNDGAKECTDAEWFPCASLLRRHRLNPSAKTRP
ncbi:MAG: hypothetical protein DMF63_05820 [Acidobacteria bacterium]|nr:MAG: hypothetical protein DMF63_05820 [Acidobacteriota bacterium]